MSFYAADICVLINVFYAEGSGGAEPLRDHGGDGSSFIEASGRRPELPL